jgi:hypothetical protein
MAGPISSVEASEEAAPEDWDGLEARDRGRVPRRGGIQVASPVSAVRGTTGNAVRGGEVHRKVASGDRAAVRTGVRDESEGRQNVVVLRPEGSQVIGLRAYEDSEVTIISRAAAARCGTDRVELLTPLMLEGPAGTQTCATEICTIVFPLEGSQGRKLEIHALVVDTLEEYYGVPQGSMWKWQMQLGIEEDKILPWLQVAQPGDRHWGKMTLERVTLSPGGASRSTWKFLVCKGPVLRIRNKSFGSCFGSGSGLKLVSDPDPVSDPDSNPDLYPGSGSRSETGQIFFILKFLRSLIF